MQIRIFKRAWWKYEKGRKVPGPSRKRTILYTDTVERAREICADYNDRPEVKSEKSNPLSIKYEFERS